MFGAPLQTPAGQTAPTSAPTLTGLTSTAPTTTATTTAPTTSVSNLSQLNFRQLQDLINKWSIELEDQEKLFIEHATKVNAWDKSLMANGEKISKLNADVDKVKQDHSYLERELEHLKNQQQDFEELLIPLEASLPANITPEPEREQLYGLAESVDVQLQQMTEDLKEIIRHINDTNKPLDKSDPVSQIMKILNEHTDALQYIEDNANAVKKTLDEVAEKHQIFRQDQEKALRGMFKYS